jgi:hypothetical protein
VKLSQVDNCQAWGQIVGQDKEFPHLIKCDGTTYEKVWPGMLVTSYNGQKHTDETGRLGLGIVIEVQPHPEARGDIRFMCTVLWNWR